MMCKGNNRCKQLSETGFIFVNRVKFGCIHEVHRKKDPHVQNRLANVCLDC